ncbi:MAG: hypothetical protein Q8K63_09470 [Acidimicrobiales bacterium]|nr:hypothetical protein [Acidimicrobiales bacterium]
MGSATERRLSLGDILWVIIALAIASWVLATAKTDSIQPADPISAVALGAWMTAPLLWYLWSSRSVMRYLVAGLFVGVLIVNFDITYENTHSTAAFGLFFFPIYAFAALLAARAIEGLLHLVSNRRSVGRRD